LKTKNPFGKQQSDIDLLANTIVNTHMKNSGVVAASFSEETPEVSSISFFTISLENHFE